MSRFYKTTKTPTVDYAYVYPFEELFKAMKYKQDRHDKALETLQTGYDDFLDLKYRPADGERVANIRQQAESFIENASGMPLHNAQGYIQQGINGIMNTQEVKDIATNYDNWIVQEQAKQQLQANEQWTPESQNVYSNTPTSEIPGNINSMMHTPKTNWRDDAEQYFNNMKLPYQNSAGVRAEARAGAPSFVSSGPGYNALVDIHGQQAVDGLYARSQQGDQNATSQLNKMAEDILYNTGREIYDIADVEETKINNGSKNVPDDYAESLYNKQVGAVINGRNGAKLNSQSIQILGGGTESKFGNENAFQITPQNITSYNELQGNNLYVQADDGSWSITSATSDQMADANLQSLQIQQLKAFKDSPYYTYYQNQVDAEEETIKNLNKPGIQNTMGHLEAMRDGTKFQTNGVYIPAPFMKMLYPEYEGYGERIKPADIAEGGTYADFFTKYNDALSPSFGKGSITSTNAIINKNVGDVAGVDDYNAQIRSLRNIGIVNPFDTKWKTLVEKFDLDNEGSDDTKVKARKTFNTVLRNNGTSLDFVPDANSNVTTRMVLGDDGEPSMVMVVKGNYIAGHNDLNNIFKKSNGFDQDYSMTDGQALGGMGSGDWGDTWWEVYGDENDGDFVTGLITRSDLTHKLSDGSGGVKTYPLFEIPATIEIPIDENTSPDYNKALGQYKTGQIQSLTPYWAEEFDAILMSNIAQNEIDFDKAQGNSRVTSINANFNGLIQKPDMTEYDDATGQYTDRRHTYLDNWMNDADLGLMTHLDEAFPNKGLIYNEMTDILGELKGDVDAHINGQGDKADLKASLHSLSTIYAAMNPSYFDEGIYLTPSAKQEKFRQFVNLMDSGGDASTGAYGLDNTNSNAAIGITNGTITDKTKLRSSSRSYATKNNFVEFDQSKYSNISTSELYAPFISSNGQKALEYMNTLDLGGKLTLTSLMRLPGYDKIVGKTSHPGHGPHTDGRACDIRFGTAAENLFLSWNTAAGRNEMITNGIVNMIKESDHYHMEFAR